MKRYLSALTTTVFLMSAAFSSTSFSEEINTESIKAFADICIKTAPTFANADKVALTYGITKITDAGFMKMGFNKDHSLSVQIQDNKECAVTTPSQPRTDLTKEFLTVVSAHAGAPIAKSVPAKAVINNSTYIFHHDRKGGEAFVMLKQ